jgi:hypothetical protein
MKSFIKPIYILLLFVIASCTDDITSQNTNPKAYQAGTVPGETFFSNATRNLVDAVTYGMTFKILAQQFSETTYFDVSSYNLSNVGSGFWVSMYRDVLLDYKEAKTVITDNPGLFPAVTKNKLAIIELLEVYTYSLLVNTYGNIPYSGAVDTSLKSEALDADNLTPAYDDAAAIYSDLFVRLDNALASLDTNSESFGTADLIYGGDIAQWIKFGNSLKLRMAVTLADVNVTKAKSMAESAASKVFSSNSDNADMTYLSTTPNTNPIWVNLVQSGREDYVASNTMMDIMESSTLDDPRIPLYYTADNAGGYSGGIYGTSNSYVTFSKAGSTVTAATFPGVLLDYVEVAFYLAEAAERGFDVGGTAEEFYNEGIKASILYWGGTQAQGTAFLADPSIAFTTASGTNFQKIARQKYVALFNRGLEAWTEYRRLDFPAFNTPPSPNGDFPIRYTYPNSEQTSNGENYTTAAAAIGGDLLTTKVFWDLN